MPPKPSFAERLLHRLHILPTPVMDAFGAVIFARTLTVALRRGVFESVSKRPLSLEEMAKETGLSPEGTKLLAEACVEGGYLGRRDGMYCEAPEGRKWLVKSSRTYLGDLVFYFDSLNTRLSGLEYSLEHGRPREPYYASFTESDWDTYVRGMANLARLLIPDVVRRIRLPDSGGRILDLGGSHGLYPIACLGRFRNSSAVVMDFAPALERAAAMHDGTCPGGIEFAAGDILTGDLPGGRDAVFMFNIVHGFDEETNMHLIARAWKTLRGGGNLYILDQMTGTGHRSLLSRFIPLMVGLNLLNEIGGSSYSVSQIREWCRGASRFRVMPLRFPGVTLIEAGGWPGG
jgi:hypothetical protein